MGKKRSNSRKRKSSKIKRRKKERYWIEDFPEIYSEDQVCDLTVWITRALLNDNHCIGQATVDPKKSESTGKGSESIINELKDEPLSLAEPGIPKQESASGEEDTKCPALEVTPEPENKNSEERKGLPDSACLQSEAENHTVTKERVSINDRREREPRIYIRRAATENTTIRFISNPNFRHLPNGDCGDGIVNPYPKSEVPDKYWAQRKRLFSRFEDGIKLDREGWFSVTPEAIAKHIAKRTVEFASSCNGGGGDRIVVLDTFCGVGGNAIAFATRPEVALVVCVDTESSRLNMAAHNCNVYEIPKDKVVFVQGDSCQVLDAYSNGYLSTKPAGEKHLTPMSRANLCGYKCGGLEVLPNKLDAIFLSPPWGGTAYEDIGPRHYDLGMIHVNEEVDGEKLLHKAREALPADRPKNIVYFLPRNINGLGFARSSFRCGCCECIELEMNFLNHKFKTITAYMDSCPCKKDPEV